MHTMYEVHNLLLRMIADPKLRSHALTLLGPRTRGSTTKLGIEQVPVHVSIWRVVPQVEVNNPACKYYIFNTTILEGRLKALPYCKAVSIWGKDAIKEREGVHGKELYVISPEDDGIPINNYSIIIGPPNEYEGFEEGIIYTWHPGKPLAVYNGQLNDWVGVKIES